MQMLTMPSPTGKNNNGYLILIRPPGTILLNMTIFRGNSDEAITQDSCEVDSSATATNSDCLLRTDVQQSQVH
eukprot:scaffold10570_cov290-Chaetoceros_neogracile.AAC.5